MRLLEDIFWLEELIGGARKSLEDIFWLEELIGGARRNCFCWSLLLLLPAIILIRFYASKIVV